ncbi:helix-turn-helix transcriptional regulator [Leptolyngbya cf. ectocarpi LEGE 11479]|uniref:Helix-turn-helix transcriptional regulator n=1 Tax=Leptolyngbya cf. ectocarpi LEGE 11479 TaxID=1828722 RepID=A0A928ZVQ1_LEPEC|nr:helix-turn-helix transcriptional regulator [Leptolyngbya ectocarpi]MBE9068311.1 helix-turn-helix transcriptional regulator [Leptolyngbya cf. ectocarpi LEGE 11479]
MTSQSAPLNRLNCPSSTSSDIAPAAADRLEGYILSNWLDGILILTQDGHCIESNRLGREICDRIDPDTLDNQQIPSEIWTACQILIESRRDFPKHLVTAESELRLKPSHEHFRIRARWFNTGQKADPHILVILENQKHAKQNLAVTEAIRYSLSPREADVWTLHRIGYTYQEIAAELHIALNTVKKHMKNTYAKQHLVSIARNIYLENLAS